MVFVSSTYHLPPRVLPSIQAVEGGGIGVVHRNADGSEDLGVMQVNTLWLQPLSSLTHLSEADVRSRLLDRPCFNIAAAGLILRSYLTETKGDLLRAVGDYHSHTPSLNHAYQARVLRSAAVMFPRVGQK
jgi:Transglycosylase SLT domain